MIFHSDCLNAMRDQPPTSVDLIYADPPFYSQKHHLLRSRTLDEYRFTDRWTSVDAYKSFMKDRLVECRRLLKHSGSIFLHCDRAASHHLRLLLDETFGPENFQSEIVWNYRRWSNNKKGLLNAHQTIFFYSKTSDFKFNLSFTDYSASTNIDQIQQKRMRDVNGKSKYKRSHEGQVDFGGVKKGVPLGDVWDIPYLNPKASERTGYPTQKPIHLLERIIELVTDEDDLVLDPFCGSGTSLVAAKLLGRRYVGIDSSGEAIELTRQRLEAPIKSESKLLKNGRETYATVSASLLGILDAVGARPVQRNSGIDGYLREAIDGMSVPVRVQREYESLEETKRLFRKACEDKGCKLRLLVRTHSQDSPSFWAQPEEIDLIIINSLELSAQESVRDAWKATIFRRTDSRPAPLLSQAVFQSK